MARNGPVSGSGGPISVSAASAVDVNQAITNPASTSPLTILAGTDINLNAQIDGRNANAVAPSGAVTMSAGQNINLNDSIVTENASIGLTAQNGSVTTAAGKGLFAGSAPIVMGAKGNITTGMSSSGALTVTSGSGSVALNGVIDSSTGAVNISAGADVNINQPVLNVSTGNALNVTAGNDINVNAAVDGRDGVAGGAVTLSASRNLNVNDFIGTNNGAISLTASNGTVSVALGKGLFAGTAPIAINAKGNITTDVMSGGTITVTSSAGAVALNGLASGSGGPISISAAGAVDVNQAITNPASNSPLTLFAGTDINLNAQIDGRDANAAAPSGAVTMSAGQNINLNDSIVTENASIGLTAQNGSVTTAAGKGLFAGSAPIAVTSGGTLSTGILTTTGSLTLRSTAGSLGVDTPIDGTTGAVTLTAAGAVDVNQPIANPRSDAPLTVTAGTDISVNAPIDGRDLNAASPGGMVTMTAGQNINLNQSIVSENAAITLTAQSGAVTTAASMGLFAGNAPLSVTSGATLDTGILATTGALNVRSTAGAVNVNTPIDDTTGAVTITAATAVNINHTITNIKTGNPLSITAGADLNLNAQVDGRNGTAAGGSVTLTAGNNLRLFDNIATNNGAINLSSTIGSVFLAPASQDANRLLLAPPKQVLAGSAPITIVSGGDFSTGARPPQPIPNPTHGETDGIAYERDFLKQYVQLVTTGPLNITSTNGNVNVDAPISDMTGPVTITAGNAINVKHKISSDNQPITLNAGPGGITTFPVNTTCSICRDPFAPVDARNANLTLNSVGNVFITGGTVGTSQTLTIDTRGQIVTGSVGLSRGRSQYPSKQVLIADLGIPSFNTGEGGDISATSSGGSIALAIHSPSKLRITTGTPGVPATDCPTCDITTGGWVGSDVVLNAGGSVNFNAIYGGTVTLIARAGDVNIGSVLLNRLTANAGRDVKLNSRVWIDIGPLALTAGRDIVTTANSPIHVSGGQAFTLSAGRNVTLNLLEMLGPVSITATAGNITLNNPIGPAITPSFDPDPNHKGVASLSLGAPLGGISMTGAWAQGAITIEAGGNLTSSREIVSVLGSRSISAANGTSGIVNAPIGTQDEIEPPGLVLPMISPGPTILPPPAAPGLAGAPAPGFPVLLEIAVADQPGSVGTIAQPGATGDTVALPGSPGGATAPGAAGETVVLPGSSSGATAPGVTGAVATLPGSPGGVTAPGAIGEIAALPGSPGGVTAPGAMGANAALPGSPAGGSAAAPSGSTGEDAADSASTERALRQGTTTAAETTGDDATLVVLASSDSEAADQQEVLCPAGAAPGSSVKTKDAAGRTVTVTCK
ncbi:MAG: hypothetical protein AAB654_09100 [Acidobacteriota bacterium]